MADVATDAQGRTFALVLPDRSIARLVTTGRSLDVRLLDVPVPLAVPTALDLDDRGRLLVLDQYHNVVRRFRYDGAALRPDGSIALDAGATDMCAMHGRVFVYRPAESTPVSVYNVDGRPLGRFGSGFGSGSPLRRRSMSNGQIACAAADSTVVLAAAMLGEVRGYRMSGRLAWSKRLAGLRNVAFLGDGRSVSLHVPPGGAHLLLSTTPLQRGVVVMQYGFQATPRQPTEFDRVETRLLSVATGDELGRQTNLPPWVFAAGQGRLLSADRSPSRRTVLWQPAYRRSR